MNEETNTTETETVEQPVEVTSAELHDVVNAINKQSYEMQLDHVETKEDLEELKTLLTDLKTLMESQQPTPEEVEQDTATTETSQQTLDSIKQEMVTMNSNVIALQEEMPKETLVVEGFYLVGLSVVITFAVYMFWNQLSKW